MEVKVAVFGYLRFPPGSIDSVRPHLMTFVEATREHDGCIAYDVAEDLGDPGLIRFSELWPSEKSLDAHLTAPHIAPWREAAKKLGLQERVFTAYTTNSQRLSSVKARHNKALLVTSGRTRRYIVMVWRSRKGDKFIGS